jgi:hypothetical protein
MPDKLKTVLKYIGAFIVALIVPGGFIVGIGVLIAKYTKYRKNKEIK